MIIYWIEEGEIEFDLGDLHPGGGWVIMISLLVGVIGGFMTYSIKNDEKWNTRKIILFRRVHRYAAFIALIASFLTISTGLEEWLEDTRDWRHL